jgi:hypothetical protein
MCAIYKKMQFIIGLNNGEKFYFYCFNLAVQFRGFRLV